MPENIQWMKQMSKAIETAKGGNKLVLLDFTRST